MTYNLSPEVGDVLTTKLPWKSTARVAANDNQPLTGAVGPIDGVTLIDGDLLLLVSQTLPEENGLWIYNSAGAWTRSAQMDDPVGIRTGDAVFVAEGTENAGILAYVTTANPIVVGTTPVQFEILARGGSDEGYSPTYVGDGGDFEFNTIADAVDAGATDIVVVTPINETRDTIATRTLNLNITANATVNLGDYQIKLWKQGATINLLGFGGNIVWSPTTSKPNYTCNMVPFTADTTNGSDIVTNMVGQTTADLRVGQSVNGGPSVPNDAFIEEILSADSFRINTPVTGASTPGETFNASPTNGLLLINGILHTIGSSATAANCHVGEGFNSISVNGQYSIHVPNQPGWGFHTGDATVINYCGIYAIIATGGGSNKYNYLSAGVSIPHVVLVGEFHATNPVISPSSGDIGLVDVIFATAPVHVSTGGSINGYTTFAGVTLNVKLTGQNAALRNCRTFIGDVDVDNQLSCELTNVTATNIVNEVSSNPGATVFNDVYVPAIADLPLEVGKFQSPYKTYENIDSTDSPHNFSVYETVIVDCSGGDVVLNLPTTSDHVGRVYSAKKTDAGPNTITVNATNTIDGLSTYIITDENECATFQSDGTMWRVIAKSPAAAVASGWQKSGSNVILSTITDDVGIGAASPAAALHVARAVLVGELVLGDYVSGGSVGSAASTVDISSFLKINQNTAGQSLFLPDPSNTSVAGRLCIVINTGSVNFDMVGVTIGVDKGAAFIWSGALWIPYGQVNGWSDNLTYLSVTNPFADVSIGAIGAPAAKLHVEGAVLYGTQSLPNFSSSGNIDGPSSIDLYSSISINQTTAGPVSVTIDPPLNTTEGRRLTIANIGTVALDVQSTTVFPNERADFVWVDSAWNTDKLSGSTRVGNVSLGRGARALSPGNQEVAIGEGAMANVTTSDGHNVVVGNGAAGNATELNASVIVGRGSGAASGTISGMSVVGDASLINCVGISNNAFGENAGNTITTGEYNLFLGSFTDADAGGRSGSVAMGTDDLGNAAIATVDNGLFFHKAMASSAGSSLMYDATSGQIGPVVSSRRFKSNERQLETDPTVIYKLEPKTYERKRDGVTEFGYMAEDVVKVLPEIVPLDAEGAPLSVTYSHLVVLLVEEVRKLRAEVDALKEGV